MKEVTELFRDTSYGQASALSIAYFLIIFVLTGIVLFLTSRKSYNLEK